MQQLPPVPEPPAQIPGGLLDYWHIAQRRKGALLLLTFVGGLSALLLTLPQTPIYQARTSVEVQGLNGDFLNMRSVNPTTEAGSLIFPEYDVQTQIRVLGSRSLVERVIRKLYLEHKPLAEDTSRIAAWRRALGIAGSGRSSAIEMAANNLRVRGQPNTRLVELSCDSTDPRLAAQFVNTLAQEFIEQNLESRWRTTQATGQWLERQMQDIKIKLEHSEDELQNYARATGLLFTSERDNVAEERLHQLQAELSKSQADRVARQSKFEMASGAAPETLPEVLDDGSLREMQSKLTDLRRQLAELNESFTAEHPKVKRVHAQIAELQTSLTTERGNILRRIKNDYQASHRREALLAADYNAQARLVSDQAEHVAHYQILKREVDTNRQMYESMLQRVKEAGVASALRASNIRIIDPALPPTVPYKPNLFHNTLAGLLVGAVAGYLLLVTHERSGRRLQEPGDAEFFIGLPELGVIPTSRKQLTGPAGARSSAITESFRTAVAPLLFKGNGEERPRVLVLSSPSPKEGKTTVAANLAIALAEVRCRVLAIDADLRRPRLHEAFALTNERGLADLLRAKKPAAECIQSTAIAGLSVLTAGQASVAEAALLYGDRLSELIEEVRGNYDAILIDTPPMAALADARVVARHTDGVILVARANQTSRDALEAAHKRFSEDGTRVLGTILNDWNPKHASRYGNHRYLECYRDYEHA